MRKFETKRLVQSVVIKTPCSVGWENMEGDDKVRFCGQCKLNVHNLSNMSESEAAATLLAGKNSRLCVFFYWRKDGTIITDNCPVKLRAIRNQIRAWVASLVVGITCLWALTASSHGLDSTPAAPLDPRYGGGGEVGMLADYGHDSVRDVSKLSTIVSFVISFLVPMDKRMETDLKLVATELIALACIPILVYLAGNIWVDWAGVGR